MSIEARHLLVWAQAARRLVTGHLTRGNKPRFTYAVSKLDETGDIVTCRPKLTNAKKTPAIQIGHNQTANFTDPV